MLAHAPPRGHPESPERLAAVIDALEDADLDLEPLEAPLVAVADLALVHTAATWRRWRRRRAGRGVPAARSGHLALARLDRRGAPRGGRSGRRGAARWRRARPQRAFCAVRPPGHHAGPEHADGLLPLSPTWRSARGSRRRRAWRGSRWSISTCTTATARRTCSRRDPDLLFASIHQCPGWPGTGDPSETGVAQHGQRRRAAPSRRARLWRRRSRG